MAKGDFGRTHFFFDSDAAGCAEREAPYGWRGMVGGGLGIQESNDCRGACVPVQRGDARIAIASCGGPRTRRPRSW